MKKICFEKIPLPKTQEEWLHNRAFGIGGSDAAAAIGCSPWKSSYTLWCEKTGRIHNDEDNEAMRIGRDLEDYVAKRFCEATGKKVKKSKYSFKSIKQPFMLANVDRLIVGEDAGLECKTASALTKTKYDKGDIPLQYYVQCMHYMAVTGKKKWYIAILVLGKGFYWYEVNRDEAEIENLMFQERCFWDYVQDDEQPPIDDSESTSSTLQDIYMNGSGNYIDLNYYQDKVGRHDEINGYIKKLEKEKRGIENVLKDEIRDALGGISGNKRIEWKEQTQLRVDSEKLRKSFPDIYKQCLKEIKFRKFTVKEENE